LDPDSARDAQTIVASYLKVVETQAATDVYPSSVRDLPHSKETIRAAFRLATTTLASAGHLTQELGDYLEIAYVSLADYVDEEAATLLREYARAGEELASDSRLAREKSGTDAWRRVSEQSRLAGQLAKAISAEAGELRAEFQSWRSDATAGPLGST
jgi:nucleotide-binding universal stress UspA family protein